MNPLMLCGVALAISVACNGAVGWLWLHARDERAVAETQRDEARGAATACSDATEALRTLADKQAADGKAAVAEAKATAGKAAQRADHILSRAPSQPGNDCASAQDRVTDWLKTRGQQ
jgi:hypothetical protein